MIAAIAHKTPGIILDKLTRLFIALQEVKNNYELIGAGISNLQLKLSVLALAQESKQYANELIAHIETLGGEFRTDLKSEFNRVIATQPALIQNGNENENLVQLRIGEQLVLKTYREVLNEPYLYDTIRQMIRYQQNGLLHCFSQIRMLYSTLLRAIAVN